MRKFGDNPTAFPDLVDVIDKVHKNPLKEFRLSDNAYMNYNKVVIEKEEIKHTKNSFVLSHNGSISDDKCISGSETTVITTTTIIPDIQGEHLMSGDKSTYSQEVVIRENTPTLGRLMELEEQQARVIYSKRDLLQAPIIISGDIVQWLVARLKDQLWDSPTIINREILYYCEGNDKPLTVTKLKNIILNDSIRYQPPIKVSEEVDYWRIKPNNRQLWNTPTITNEEIRSYWDGTEIPEMREFEYFHLIDDRLYQPPITIADSPFYWVTEHMVFDRQWLWQSSVFSNQDLELLYSLKFDGEQLTLGKLIEMEEKQIVPYSFKNQWQPPLIIIEEYTTELDKNEQENPWLWSSTILTNNELNTIYENRLGLETPNLEHIINSEETQQSTVKYSLRGNEQSPIQIVPSQ